MLLFLGFGQDEISTTLQARFLSMGRRLFVGLSRSAFGWMAADGLLRLADEMQIMESYSEKYYK